MTAAYQDPDGPTTAADAFGPRPYTLTRGRTQASRLLRLETLVEAATEARDHRSLMPEHEQIRRMCAHPRSVAEISAVLGIPIGVMRILVADLADSGLVRVHEQDERGASAAMLQRVLHGLERL
ncbi:DUF742 domain-containing protein [Streptomyces sp. H27-H1]|uniref:DUF742 domain-containing protein n=1 Tax=Streptomyces sp. H27-H1 TaxID=2996461 RepID=UPI002271BB26|nr:DUF742 domain-containing protein [Streptomyces sp. H27-H1]MCY0932162.1 DUF742 domain-containing protein [Streptomyces sp. H27-H1]